LKAGERSRGNEVREQVLGELQGGKRRSGVTGRGPERNGYQKSVGDRGT